MTAVVVREEEATEEEATAVVVREEAATAVVATEEVATEEVAKVANMADTSSTVPHSRMGG